MLMLLSRAAGEGGDEDAMSRRSEGRRGGENAEFHRRRDLQRRSVISRRKRFEAGDAESRHLKEDWEERLTC